MKELVERYLRLKMVEEYARIDAFKARELAAKKGQEYAAAQLELQAFEDCFPKVLAFLNAPAPERKAE